jgi:hypothetical protein
VKKLKLTPAMKPCLTTKKLMKLTLMLKKMTKTRKTTMSKNSRVTSLGQGAGDNIYPGTFNSERPKPYVLERRY